MPNIPTSAKHDPVRPTFFDTYLSVLAEDTPNKFRAIVRDLDFYESTGPCDTTYEYSTTDEWN